MHDGKVWSAAGVSAGIDMMLALIASVTGVEAAGKLPFYAAYDPDGVCCGDFGRHAQTQSPAYIRRG